MTEPADEPSTTAALPVVPPAPAASNPFQPTMKIPWVNPDKRGVVAGVAAVLAVVLLGFGFIAGAVVVRHHDHHGGRGQVFFGHQGYAPLPQRYGHAGVPGGVPGRPGPGQLPSTGRLPSPGPTS